MGAMAIDSPICVEVFFVFVFVVFSPHLGDWVCVFGVCVCVFCVFWSIGVCVECVFPLSNSNNLRNYFLHSSIDCDSEITSPTLIQNPHILHGLH